jgi:hypothetical protein
MTGTVGRGARHRFPLAFFVIAAVLLALYFFPYPPQSLLDRALSISKHVRYRGNEQRHREWHAYV